MWFGATLEIALGLIKLAVIDGGNGVAVRAASLQNNPARGSWYKEPVKSYLIRPGCDDVDDGWIAHGGGIYHPYLRPIENLSDSVFLNNMSDDINPSGMLGS